MEKTAGRDFRDMAREAEEDLVVLVLDRMTTTMQGASERLCLTNWSALKQQDQQEEDDDQEERRRRRVELGRPRKMTKTPTGSQVLQDHHLS